MKRFFLLLLIVIILYAILIKSNQKKENKIKPFLIYLFETPYSGIDTFYKDNQRLIYKNEYYLVEGYQNTLYIEQKIDSFVCHIKNTHKKRYSDCRITIYKESEITNIEHLKEHSKDFIRYSLQNDRIFSYGWIDDVFVSKEKQNTYYDIMTIYEDICLASRSQ